MLANNASGTRTVKYGGTKDNVYQFNFILPNGERLKVGNLARKSSSGYDLKHLFIGSEGTLGVVTRNGLKLAPIPADRVGRAFWFETLGQAVEAAVDMAWAVPDLAAIELLDAGTMGLIKAFLGSEDVPTQTTLFIEFHSMNSMVPQESIGLGEQVASAHGGEVLAVESPWRIRHYGTRAVTARHGAVARTDAGVPVSRLKEYMDWAVDFVAPEPVYAFGHVGIGIVHLLIPVDPSDGDSVARAAEFKKQAALAALRMGGTVSGEHGIGIGNIETALVQYGKSWKYMKDLKTIFDPRGLMNPGKLL
jgi:D-lactate dehydrogenase (cytochrome)